MKFNRTFWITTCFTAVLGAVILMGFAPRENLPAKPDYPVPGKSYLSAYTRGHTDHYLFAYDLFGFGQKIKQADILIMGASHAEFGISAAQLSAALSERHGRPITVFNAALGFVEGLEFDKFILTQNNIRNKTVLFDLFMRPGLSDFGQKVMHADRAMAMTEVLSIWADFTRDWLLDGILPRLKFADGIKRERFLTSPIIRDWHSGDVVDLWQTDKGSSYQNPPASMLTRFDPAPWQWQDQNVPGLAQFSPQTREFFVQENLRPILTLVPFRSTRAADGRAIAVQAGYPFIEINTAGLRYWDKGEHVTAASRTIITRQLADRLRID